MLLKLVTFLQTSKILFGIEPVRPEQLLNKLAKVVTSLLLINNPSGIDVIL